MKRLAIVAALSLAGCSSQAIALRDPASRQVIECKADPWVVLDVQSWNEECARKYERNGFERLK